MRRHPLLLGKLYPCDCGTEATVIAARWNYWIQLAPHRQPNGLVCNPGRLQSCIPMAEVA